MSTGQLGLLISIMAAFQAALVIWVKASIEGAVKHQWDRDLEEVKYEMRRREQAAMIAELLAEWDSQSSDRKRLNQLVLEATFGCQSRSLVNLIVCCPTTLTQSRPRSW